jgi:hypothetical protein
MTALNGSSLLPEIIVHFDGYMPQGLALRDAAAIKDSQLDVEPSLSHQTAQ